MTAQRLSEITGYRVEEAVSENGVFGFAAYDEDGKVIASEWGRHPQQALRQLHAALYGIRRKQALDAADWQCQLCSSRNGLQVHHKRFRSHGRLDLPENLEVLCLDCHSMKHGIRP